MDDPQLRAKLETLMLVYPDVTVERALAFLDEASEMIDHAEVISRTRARASRRDSRLDPISSREFSVLANLDDTEEMQP